MLRQLGFFGDFISDLVTNLRHLFYNVNCFSRVKHRGGINYAANFTIND